MTMAAASEKLQRPAVRVLDTALVRPSSGPPEETSLPLTFFDVFWSDVSPGTGTPSRTPSAHSSRSPAASGSPPAQPTGTSSTIAFTVAEYGDGHDLDSLAADDPREVAAIAPLAPPLPHAGAVLELQATLLSGRRGLALGVTVHHAACDGAASTHFLHTWAAAAPIRSPLPPPPPVIDRTLISDPRGLYDVFCPAAGSSSTAEDMGFVKMPDDQRLATFTLSRAHLQRVKDVVAASVPRCSSLVATLGFVWSCYHRAKPRDGDGDGDGGERTCMLFSVDHRSRLKPPLPNEYFGNCVASAFAIASRSDLLAEAGGFLTACTAVAGGIKDAVSGGDATETMGAWMERIREAVAMGMLPVAGSPRFRVYDLDFGFGRPAKVDIVSVAKTGAVAVAESRAGDGGIEVGVSLPPEGMDAFLKCFADAIQALDLEVKL